MRQEIDKLASLNGGYLKTLRERNVLAKAQGCSETPRAQNNQDIIIRALVPYLLTRDLDQEEM